MLDRRPVPAAAHVCTCELCCALLAVAESIVRVEAAERAAAERRRATIHLIEEEAPE